MVFKPDLGVNGIRGGSQYMHQGNVIRNVCEEQIKSVVNCALKSARKPSCSGEGIYILTSCRKCT